MLRITLLGGLRITPLEAGAAVVLRTRKTRALLAYLASPPGRAHPRDKLAALLWGDCSDRQAQTNLRQALYGLRKALAPVEPQGLRAVGDAVTLEPARVEVDSLHFEHLVSEGTPAALAAALKLYQGELLEGLAIDAPAFEEWLLGERERLRERAIEAMARVLAHQQTVGAFEAAVQTGMRLLTLEPAQESVHRAVIRLQLRLGRRGAALRQYQTCIHTLQRDLGIEPEAETKQLYQEVLRAVPGAVKAAKINNPVPPPPVEMPLKALPAQDPYVARTLARMPFVGRREELEQLMGKLGVARSGTGGVAFLVGEPGIGKTRLLEEFAAQACGGGAHVLWGRCFEGELSRPFGPFAEAIAGYAMECEPEALREEVGSFGGIVAKIAPELRERLPDLPVPEALAPEEERYRLLDAVAQVFWALARKEPRVLVLDDLHWADGATFVLLRHLSRFLSRHPVLILGAYRDVELDRQHPLGDALAALQREVEVERIALSGLPREAVTQLLEAIAQHEVPANFVEAMTIEIGGNPLFLREVLLHLIEEGKLERAEGRFTSHFSIEEMGIPEGVRQVIGRRLSRLSEEANRLLAGASGCGGVFRFELAAAVADLEERSALVALDEVLEAQLVRTTGDPEVYDFTHALIRHTLYGEMNPARQVRLHRRLAEEMERRYGAQAAEHAFEIAQQWHRSAALLGAERGVVHCIAAADRSDQAAAHEEAVTALRMALDLLPAGDVRRPRLLGRLGLALARSLKNEEAVRVASEAGELLAASEGSNAASDYLAEATTAVYGSAFDPRGWPLAEQGLRHVGVRRDLTWATLTFFDLDRREAADLDFPGIPLDVPERREASRILIENWSQAVERGILLHSCFFESRKDAIARAGMLAPVQALLAGEYEAASTLASELVVRNLERGRLALAVFFLLQVAICQAALGNLTSSHDAVSQANALLERIGNPPALSFFLQAAPMGQTFVRGEGYELFLPVFDRVFADDAPGIRFVMAIALAEAAAFYAHAGRGEDALRALGRILPAIERAAGWAHNYSGMVYYAIEVLWILERRDHADALERNLRAKTLAPDFRYLHTDARLALARLCALTGRFNEAREWFEKARRVLDEQGALPLRAIVDFDEAWMEVRRGEAGNRERALALFDTARGPFESIGMLGWLRRADELRRQLDR